RAGNRARAQERHDLHDRAHGERRQAPRAAAAGRLDRDHQGSLALGAVGAHGAGHRVRRRRAYPRRRRPPALTAARMGVADTGQPHAMLPAGAHWPLLLRLPAQLAAAGDPPAWRELLRQAHEELSDRFLAEEPVEDLVHARAALVDLVLRAAWARHGAGLAASALV